MRALLLLPLMVALPAAAAPLKVGVLYFDNLTGDPAYDVLKKGLADMIITDLVAVPGVVVVERARLQDVLTEQSLQGSKFFDPATAVKTGKLVGASHVLTGSLIAFEPQLRLDVRLVDVKKGTVLATSAIAGPKENLFELEQQLIAAFVKTLALKGAIPKPANADTSAELLLAYSKGLDLADQGDYAKAQSAMAGVMQAAPAFPLAKTRYAELLQRVAEASERRDTAMSAQERELDAKVRRAQQQAIPADKERAKLAFGYRVVALTLAMRRMKLAVLQGDERPKGPVTVIAPARRRDVGRAEVELIATIDSVRRDLMAYDPSPPSTASFEVDPADKKALEQLLGSAFLPFTVNLDEPELRRMRASVVLGGELDHLQWRPTPAQRMPELLETALAQAREASGDEEFDTWHNTDVAGVALVRAGRKEDAIALWQGFLDKHPKAEKFPDTRKRIEDTLMVTADLAKAQRDLQACAPDSMMSWQRLLAAVALVDRRAGVEQVLKQIEKCAPKQGGLAMGWKVNGLILGAGAAAELGDCDFLAALKKRGDAMPASMRASFVNLPECR